MRRADWYFDFVSPFSYFAFHRLHELPQLDIGYRPVLFAALLDHWGQKGPAEIAPKRQWLFRWCLWQAQQYGIPFRLPAAHPFNPLPYLRLALAAGCTESAIGTLFDALWNSGADAADPALPRTLAQRLGLDPEMAITPAVKDQLRLNTEDAAARQIFGVPSLVIDGQAFWGADAMDFARAFLADPSILDTPEMRRVAELPIAAMRKGQ